MASAERMEIVSTKTEAEFHPQSEPSELTRTAALATETTATKTELEDDTTTTIDSFEPTDTTTTTADKPPLEPSADAVPAEATLPKAAVADEKKWPGWPGNCVFRLIVPVLKVGGVIGRKGELIKKMCEQTRARIRVLDAPQGTPDRIVLISGKEEPEAPLSPAMDAAVRVFRRVSGLLPESDGDGKATDVAGMAFCSIRLLVASTQAINLIGKHGSIIKSIQESTGASVRVLSSDELPGYADVDERIVELQGEALKVLKALEAVVGHLRKFLVDHSVIPLFEKSYNATILRDPQLETWADKMLLHSASETGTNLDYPSSMKRDSLFLDRDTQLDSRIPTSRRTLYGQDPRLSDMHSSGIGRAGGPIITQVSQTMQIPLAYAEDIIGIDGTNIAYIRRTSGAILTVQESRGLPDEITVEIKGTSSQVQTAQQLIQESISSQKESLAGGYGRYESTSRHSYSHLGDASYSSSSYTRQHYSGYTSSGVGGYSSFRP